MMPTSASSWRFLRSSGRSGLPCLPILCHPTAAVSSNDRRGAMSADLHTSHTARSSGHPGRPSPTTLRSTGPCRQSGGGAEVSPNPDPRSHQR
jgi:hypothetical protein